MIEKVYFTLENLASSILHIFHTWLQYGATLFLEKKIGNGQVLKTKLIF